ncbi:MAG TPA: YqjK-like family protein [Steroidobacteraceae bacterium]|nr:YqjK-like family protein [Steroidobacteraceae bacterium]
MSKRFDQLSAHHSNLLARCAVQRRQLGESAEEIEHELGRVDRGVAAVRRVLRHPAMIGGAVAVVALVGPRRLLRWATSGLMWYSTARSLIRLRRESVAAAPTHDGG